MFVTVIKYVWSWCKCGTLWLEFMFFLWSDLYKYLFCHMVWLWLQLIKKTMWMRLMNPLQLKTMWMRLMNPLLLKYTVDETIEPTTNWNTQWMRLLNPLWLNTQSGWDYWTHYDWIHKVDESTEPTTTEQNMERPQETLKLRHLHWMEKHTKYNDHQRIVINTDWSNKLINT